MMEDRTYETTAGAPQPAHGVKPRKYKARKEDTTTKNASEEETTTEETAVNDGGGGAGGGAGGEEAATAPAGSRVPLLLGGIALLSFGGYAAFRMFARSRPPVRGRRLLRN